MSITIGINANHADSAISIFENEKLIFGVEEERINRVKHWAGLPIESINYGIDFCNLDKEKISDIAFNTDPYSNFLYKFKYFIQNYLFSKKSKEIFLRQGKKFSNLHLIKKKLNLNKNIKFHFIDHHLSHLASAFYPSGFDKAIGLSIDGFGDFCSLSIAECENNKINIIEKINFPDSLGVFYEAMTQLAGFKKYGEEYKLMGLSSYGKPLYESEIIKNLFKNQELPKLNLKYFNHYKRNFEYKFSGEPNQNQLYSEHLTEILGIKSDSLNSQEIKNNIASSTQKVFEFYLLKILNKIKKLNFSNNLVYSGGCALNSLANKLIYNDNYFKNIYIPYAPGDAGGSIGAPLIFLSKKYNKFLNLNNAYIGPKFSNIYVKELINRENLDTKYKIVNLKKDNDLFDLIVANLVKKHVIGFFSGNLEFGARALGNRSIIASPCFEDMRDIINKKIKKRESFRPFAPAILKEKKLDWFNKEHDNPFMSNVEDILKEKRKFIPAVTHIDGTGRVQTVTEKTNLRFFRLLKKFYEKTEVPILLNTSFNENEPIVMKPEEAIDCFERTDIDMLVIENFVFYKK